MMTDKNKAFAASPSLAQQALLAPQLKALLGELDDASVELLRQHLTWHEIGAGQTLMTQGEPGDSMYIVVSGRLRVLMTDADGQERFVRETGRGKSLGELALYTGAPRSATVVAVRDSVLVRLDKPHFHQLLASGAQVSIAITRQVIERLQSVHNEITPAVCMSLVPVTANTHVAGFARDLAAQLQHKGRVCVVDAARVDADLQQPGIARSAVPGTAEHRRVVDYLDTLERGHEFMLMVADEEPGEWTRRCCHRADETLMLAQATEAPVLHETEQRYLAPLMAPGPARGAAAQVLVLLHAADAFCPRNTRAWLARRPVADHVHIRPGLPRDMARLARLQSRTAVGLVLAGGGARGCAHLGVYRALLESGIEIDCVGGTSIGSAMAGFVAGDQPVPQVMEAARRVFGVNPTSDFNLLPMVSLISGQRMRRAIDRAVLDTFGHEAEIEDTWKNFFCVASNYSQASEQVLRSGPVGKALRASMAIPGALPPVLQQGDLLCDGGTFNNFPVDVMRRMRGVGQVIGIDLGAHRQRRIDHDEVPGSWTLLRDRLRPRKQRKYRFPSLVAYLMNVSTLYSISRQRQSQALTDLLFQPPLERVGMLEWKKFDSIVEQGYTHAREVLAQLDAKKKAALVQAPAAASATGSAAAAGPAPS